ncbi:MAG: LexA family transcriptional regulator [Saprospirales bacterium]|nr:MAG: LexA family transcriptional regulator [Saprospirales bacterium]
MSRLGKNIGFLRKQRKWSQQELAERLGIPRPTIAGYERGYSEPNIETLIRMARNFGISVEDLIERHLWEGEKRTFDRESGMKILAISVSSENRSNIELVDARAEAGYVESFDDPSFIKDLPRMFLPEMSEGTFRAFEIRGDSMLPMRESDIVVCSYVESLSDVKDNQTYVVVTQSEGIVYKRLKNNQTRKKLVLISDNEVYPPYELPYEDTAELWKYEAHISSQEPGLSASDWMDARMESMSKDIKDIKKLLK